MKLNISKEFSTSPGPRLVIEGEASGEEFRIGFLLPRLKESISRGERLVVNLDGVSGFGTSFLEESFGGLIRTDGYSLSELKKFLDIQSNEVPEWIDEINEYMEQASNEKGQKK